MPYAVPDAAPGGLRLHLNENTAGCSPAVLDALRALGREDTACYPDDRAATAAAARWFDVDPSWVQLTNGLDEGLLLAAQCARLGLFPAGRPAASPSEAATVVFAEPAFEMYQTSAEATGLAMTRLPPESDFAFPIDAMLAALTPSVRLVYLTDPNNPTGHAIPAGMVERIATTAPDALVLVDEAYAEFSGRSFIGAALDTHRNLIVGRTFAKAHGLAGLRIGALVAHPDTLAPIRRILMPFTVNVCALRALDAAIADRAHLDWYVGQAAESRRLISDWGARLGFRTWPSETNFVLIRLGDWASAIVSALASRGFLVRDKSGAPGCAGCVRITAGVVDHTRACLDALDAALRSRPE